MTAPEFIMLDLGMIFEEQSGTAAFECLDDVCRRILWLEADEHVHMLWHDFQLFDGHIVQLRDAQQDILHLLHELRCREGWVPILRHPDQMKVEIVDVSTLIDCIWDALFSFHVYHTPSFLL